MTNALQASTVGASLSTSDTAHVASAGRIEASDIGDDPHFAKRAADDKAFATLRALLALAGHELRRTANDCGPRRFSIGRWGMVRELRDINAVVAFAKQVGATS